MNVVVEEENLLYLEEVTFQPCTIECLLYNETQCDRLFALTTGCTYGFNQSANVKTNALY